MAESTQTTGGSTTVAGSQASLVGSSRREILRAPPAESSSCQSALRALEKAGDQEALGIYRPIRPETGILAVRTTEDPVYHEFILQPGYHFIPGPGEPIAPRLVTCQRLISGDEVVEVVALTAGGPKILYPSEKVLDDAEQEQEGAEQEGAEQEGAEPESAEPEGAEQEGMEQESAEREDVDL